MKKYHTITLTNAAWGYLTELEDWSGGEIFKEGRTLDGLHTLRPGLDNFVIPGVPDRELGERMSHGFGFCRPWDEGVNEKELALQRAWAGRNTTGALDYYVAMRNGSPQPDCACYIYGEFGGHLFVHGEDEEGNPLDRYQLLEHGKHLGLRTSPDFWDPVWVFHGMNRGYPVFDKAMRADTNLGQRWGDVVGYAESKVKDLPPGYQWCKMSEHFGNLFYDEEAAETESELKA